MDTKTPTVEIKFFSDEQRWTIIVDGADTCPEGSEPCHSLGDLRSHAAELAGPEDGIGLSAEQVASLIAEIDSEVERVVIDPQDYEEDLRHGHLAQRGDGVAMIVPIWVETAGDSLSAFADGVTDEDLVWGACKRVDACDIITDAAHVRPWRPGRS